MTPEDLAPPQEIAGARCRRVEIISDYQKTKFPDFFPAAPPACGATISDLQKK
jgi:hypothetical protein